LYKNITQKGLLTAWLSRHFMISDKAMTVYPSLKVAMLEVRGVPFRESAEQLESAKREHEEHIRKNHQELSQHNTIKTYSQFFKKFRKGYPIEFQLKSIAEGRPLPSRNAVVEAMFMAELRNMFLTAAHDLDRVNGDLGTTVTKGSEEYVNISGKETVLKPEDIITSDSEGIISSVLYGPDRRTMVSEHTKNYLFFAYFPYGEDDENIRKHFADIVENIRIFARPDVGEVRIF
jgi:DNA/RNA-binding domain of Phe-tRNA-synthetase-like protein